MNSPYLLDAALRRTAPLTPARCSLTLTLTPPSTAQLLLAPGAPDVPLRALISLPLPGGGREIFRAAAVSRTESGEQRLSLEHACVTLADDLTAPDTALSGTPRQALEALLARQSTPRWTSGDIEISDTLPALFLPSVTLLEALLTLARNLDAFLDFDQSAVPWRLHLRRPPQQPACEYRLNAGLCAAEVTQDESALCTVVTFTDEKGESVTCRGEAAAVWGDIHRTLGDASAEEARRYLLSHAQPAVSASLTVSGEAFRPGALCRLSLPDGRAPLEAPLTRVVFPDLISQPGVALLTLGAERADASSSLSALQSAQSKTSGQLFRFIRETENGVEILAEEISLRATKTEVTELGTRLSEVAVELDAATATLCLKANREDVDNQFSAVEVLLDGANARIDLSAERLDEISGALSQAQIAIDGANARITEQVGVISAQGELISGAQVTIDGLKGEISQKVSKNGVISEINQTSEAVRISASKINLDGYVTASQLSAEIAELEALISSGALIENLAVDSIVIGSCEINNVMWMTQTVVTDCSLSVSNEGLAINGDLVTVVTGVRLNKNTKKIKYLGV